MTKLLVMLCPQGLVFNRHFDCIACQFDRQPTLPLNKSDSHALAHFNLIHFDVWGLSPITTMGGSQYYVVFVNDFSCYTWIYLMKNHSEILTFIEIFQKRLKLNFQKLSKFFDQMLKNIANMTFLIFFTNMAPFPIPLVQALLNKMVVLNVNLVTF